jgi:RNA polymerase sigma-70 factor (ECF subfamily)
MMMNQIVGLTYRMTGDRQTAKDLAQDAFIAGWEKIGRFRGEARFSSWLYRIATNRTLNHLKARSSQTVALPDEQSLADQGAISSRGNPERDFEKHRLRDEVAAFVSGLPEMQKTVFELRFYEEMSFDEIARLTGKAVGTVKTHYRQAVIKLREHAQQRGLRK